MYSVDEKIIFTSKQWKYIRLSMPEDYLSLCKAYNKIVGTIGLLHFQLPDTKKSVLIFPHFYPNNSSTLQNVGLLLTKFNDRFFNLTSDLFAAYKASGDIYVENENWENIGNNGWTLYKYKDNVLYMDFNLWIDKDNLGKLFLYDKSSKDKFTEVFDFEINLENKLGFLLRSVTVKDLDVKTGICVRVFLDKDSGKILAVDLWLPGASEAGQISNLFASKGVL